MVNLLHSGVKKNVKKCKKKEGGVDKCQDLPQEPRKVRGGDTARAKSAIFRVFYGFFPVCSVLRYN
jgi:hypothetical protein